MRKGKYVKCSGCGNEIYRPPNGLGAKIYFCNNTCKSRYWRQFYQVECVVCGNRFEKTPGDQKRYPAHCCSIECRTRFNNKQESFACNSCGKVVFRPPSLMCGKKNLFCSKECYDTFQDKKVEVKCDNCGKSILKSPVYIVRCARHFCSTECSSQFCYNGNVIEMLFEEQIKKLGIEYSRNNRTVLWDRAGQFEFPNQRYKCELDFYFPTIEFAVEINGQSHSLPIYGQETLEKQKVRDSRKRRMCKKAGIKLRTVWIKTPSKDVMLRKFATIVREILEHQRDRQNQN